MILDLWLDSYNWMTQRKADQWLGGWVDRSAVLRVASFPQWSRTSYFTDVKIAESTIILWDMQ